MNNTDELWVVNTHDKPVDMQFFDLRPPRVITFKPGRPIPFPRNDVLRMMNQWQTLKVCANPEKYYEHDGFKQLIMRWSLGDLLLLEPAVRALAESGRDITMMMSHQELYKWHPLIKEIVSFPVGSDCSAAEREERLAYDVISDITHTSETHELRGRMHRTDLYAMALGANMSDPEPRLYWKIGLPMFRKQKGLTYIGFCWDANETLRRYPKHLAVKVLEYFVNQDKSHRVVLFGERQYIKWSHSQCIDLQKRTTLSQLIDNVAACDGFISVDTGVLHVALTLHRPTVASFSKINPDFRVRHYTGPKVVLKNDKCQPCGDMDRPVNCIHGDAWQDHDYENPASFVPPCQDFTPVQFYEAYKALPKCDPMVHAPGKLLI